MYLLNDVTFYSSIFGVVCGLLIKRKTLAIVLVACVPVSAILANLLYNEYFVPYKGGGASMWPIALMFSATPAVICGCLSCALAQLLVKWVER